MMKFMDNKMKSKIPTSNSHNGNNMATSRERNTDITLPENSEANPTKIEKLEETPNDEQ